MNYLLRISFVLGASCIALSLVYKLIEKGLVRFSPGLNVKFTEMFEDSAYYDVLLLGSSRTHRNIDPQICDSLTRFSFYNGGISGAYAFEVETVFEGYLAVHPPPRYVALNFDVGTIITDKRLFNPTLYYKYLKNVPIYNAIKSIDNFGWLYRYIPFTRMLNLNDDIRGNALKGIIGKKDIEPDNHKGYSGISERIGKFDTSYHQASYLNSDVFKNEYLKHIVELCAANKVRPVFFIAPVYKHHYAKKYADYDGIISQLACFTKEYQIPLIRLDSIPMNESIDYFADNLHLNERGVKLFSEILAKELKPYLDSNFIPHK